MVVAWGSVSVEGGTEPVPMAPLDDEEKKRAQASEEWLDKGQKTLLDTQREGEFHE